MKNFMQPRSGVLRENHPENQSPSIRKHKQSPSVRRQRHSKENAPPDLNSALDPSPSTAGKHTNSSNGKLRSPLPPRHPSSRSNPLKRKFIVEPATENVSGLSDSGVKVIIRIRPPNKDRDEGETIVQKLSHDTLSILGQNFTFDSVADMDATQQDIFQLVGAPLVEHCLAGFNSSVFAYGQTGSGKTYTMWGPANALLEGNKLNEQQGLTPRVLEQLFAQMNEKQTKHAHKQLKYQCRCSFLEIYNEQITDLLDPSQKNLQIREDVNCGVYVENLTEECVCSMKDVSQLLVKGLSNRRTSATSVNADSSRSHSVFTCVVESRCKSMADGLSSCRTSRINLVDLAGSERQKVTGAAGERLKEAGNINRSLSQLGNLINILAEVSHTGKQRHIPYRDSRLTFLLQESLGGNAKLSMVCAISPGQCCKNETFSTLRFAQRAKAIKNKAVVNEVMQDDVNVLREVIRQLKDELLRMKEGNKQSSSNGGYSTGWNARRSLNLLKFSLNHPTTLPRIEDDSDEEMEIDEDAVEKLSILPCNPQSAHSSLVCTDQESEKDADDIDVNMEEEEECRGTGSKEQKVHSDFEEDLQATPVKSPDFEEDLQETPVKSPSEPGAVSDVSVAGLKNSIQIPNLDIIPHEPSPVLKSPIPSVSPRITDSKRKSLRIPGILPVFQTEKGILFPEVADIERPAKRHSAERTQKSPGTHERLAASLHHGLEILEACKQSSVLRCSSFRFPIIAANLKPVPPVQKIEVGVQTLPLDGAFSKDATDVVCVKCKNFDFPMGQDESKTSNMQLIPLDGGSHSRGKSKKKVNKAVEKVLTGSIRRELQLEEICVKQTSEIAQLNRLVQQYKHERECNAIIGQLREDKILRLESLMDGVLPTEDFMNEELVSLKGEHNLLKKKYENHPEASRTQIELRRAQEELEKYKNFSEFGEREVLMEEIRDLRNQLQCYYRDTNPPCIGQEDRRGDPDEQTHLGMVAGSREEGGEEKYGERVEWMSIAEELRTELAATRTQKENLEQELASARKCCEELGETIQLAIEANARMLEEYADLDAKHMQLVARNRKIREGTEDVKKAAARAGVRGAESKFINTLAKEISILRVECEEERRYFRDENEGLQAQVRDTAEAVQAAGELLVRLKEAEEAAAAAERRAVEAGAEADKAYSRIEKLKRKHEMEISSLNQKLEDYRLAKVVKPVYNTGSDDRWVEEFEPFYSGEGAGYDQCNV